MAERIIINTGPLITLAKMDALHVPEQLPFIFLCPEQVREELEAGERAGHSRVRPEWLEVTRLSRGLSKLEATTLGKGESAVIELALELGVQRVCIDEWKGRRAALTAGLKVTGVIGLLGRAKKLGLIPAVRPFVDKATAAGIRYDAELVRQVLKTVGEA